MMDLVSKLAIVEFGDGDKVEYVFVKGGPAVGEEMFAHTYWYPDDITNEEANQEILDLCEHYENVAILLPISDHMQLEILGQ